MTCQKCGNQLGEGEVFCDKCGCDKKGKKAMTGGIKALRLVIIVVVLIFVSLFATIVLADILA